MTLRKIIPSPSVLAADFGDMKSELMKIKQFNVPFVHIDIMDGHFVPNISFGPRITEDIKNHVDADLDVHLMISDTEKYVDDFIKLKPKIISFHIESVKFYYRMINHIKNSGIKVGVALNPGTPLSALDAILSDIDLVLLMTVDPGFYGQSFIPTMIKKIEDLYIIRRKQNCNFLIEVDGGINNSTIEQVNEFVDMVVLGKAFFKNPNLEELMKKLEV